MEFSGLTKKTMRTEDGKQEINLEWPYIILLTIWVNGIPEDSTKNPAKSLISSSLFPLLHVDHYTNKMGQTVLQNIAACIDHAPCPSTHSIHRPSEQRYT